MRTMGVLVVLVAVLLIAVPPYLGLGWQNTLTSMLIASLFAAAFNLLMGQGGMLSFGHSAFYGIGAFAVLHLMKSVEDGLNFPTLLLPLAGAGAGLLLGLGAGWFATMRAGVYFSLVTLALAELLHALAPNWQAVFGGESGLSSMRMPSLGVTFGSPLEVYYLTLGWVAVSLALLYAYTLTPFGRLTLALRDNERRVRFMGFNAHATKTVVFGISGLFSGIAGGLLATNIETANYSLFSTHVSAIVVLHTFVGGSTIFLGPVLGASLLTVFAFLVSEATRAWLFYQGLIFVLVMLFAPEGIAGIIANHWNQRHRLPWRRLALPYGTFLAGALVAGMAAVFGIQVLERIFEPAYQAGVSRSGIWPPVSVMGFEVAPSTFAPWLLIVVLFAIGIAVIVRQRPIIAGLWADEGEEQPSRAPASAPA
jgi:branched-chain amino acid transport system permease protein